MIIEERIGADKVRHYSDSGKMIRQVGFVGLYESAIDAYPCPYEYEEYDGQPEDESTPEELIEMLEGIL